ncbi:MAG: hypothetical protein LBC45_04265 [Chlamydiales bacterium]|nr:hypothetical protein [Chlamydiales bacterium]
MKKHLLAIGLALLQTTFSTARDHSPAQNNGFEKEGYISQDHSKELTDSSDLVGASNAKQLQADMIQRDDLYNKDGRYDTNSRRWGRKRIDDELNNGMNAEMNGDGCCAPAPKPVCCPKPKCCKPRCCPKPKPVCCPKPKCCKPKCPKPCCKPCEPVRQPACTTDGCCMPTREPSCTTDGCCEPTRLMQYEKPKCCKPKTCCKREPKCCDDNTMMIDNGNYRDNRSNMMRDRSNTMNPLDRNASRGM